MPRYRLDVTAFFVAEEFAEGGDLDGEVAFVDKCVRPDRPQDFFLCQETASVRDQDQENVERFRRQRNRAPLASEQALLGMEREGAELVGAAGNSPSRVLTLHLAIFQKPLRASLRLLLPVTSACGRRIDRIRKRRRKRQMANKSGFRLKQSALAMALVAVSAVSVRADVVTDWNATATT